MNRLGKVEAKASTLKKYRQYFVVFELPPKDDHPIYKIAVGSLKEDIETGKTYMELAPFNSLTSFLEVIGLILEGAFRLGVHGGFKPEEVRNRLRVFTDKTLWDLSKEHAKVDLMPSLPIQEKIGAT